MDIAVDLDIDSVPDGIEGGHGAVQVFVVEKFRIGVMDDNGGAGAALISDSGSSGLGSGTVLSGGLWVWLVMVITLDNRRWKILETGS